MSGIIPESGGAAAPAAPVPLVGGAASGPNGNPARIYFTDEAGAVVVFDHFPLADTATRATYYEAGFSPATSPRALTFSSATAGQPFWLVRDNQSTADLWEQAVDDSLSATGEFSPITATGTARASEVPEPVSLIEEVEAGTPPLAPIPII